MLWKRGLSGHRHSAQIAVERTVACAHPAALPVEIHLHPVNIGGAPDPMVITLLLMALRSRRLEIG
jgi:hypothetical protein